MGAAHKLNLVVIDSAQSKARVKLRAKPRAKLEIHKLPFVGRDHVQDEGGGVCFWDVPLTGGYFGGQKTGAAIAYMFLSHRRQQVGTILGLGNVLSALMSRSTDTAEEADTLKGQLIGFCGVIENWVDGAVRELGTSLDGMDHEKVLSLANAGITNWHSEIRPRNEGMETLS